MFRLNAISHSRFQRMFCLGLIVASSAISSVLLSSAPALAESDASTLAQASQQQRGLQLQKLGLEQQRLGTAEAIQQAIAYYQEALKIWQTLGNTRQQTAMFLSIGTAYYTLSQHEQALDFFQQGLKVAQAAQDDAHTVYLLSSVGNAYYSLDQAQKALDYYQQTLDRLKTLENPVLTAAVLTSQANAYTKLGQTQAAIASYQRSLKLYQDLKDPDGEAQMLRFLGALYFKTGQNTQAEAVLKQSIAVHQQADDSAGQLSGHTLLGTLYMSQGKVSQAITTLETALALLDQQQNTPFHLLERGGVLHALAAAYWLNNDNDKALRTFNRALSAARAQGNQEFVATILSDMGIFYDQRGEPQQALASFGQALAIYQQLKLSNAQISALVRIGEAKLALGEHQNALDTYDQAIRLARSIDNPVSEGDVLSAIADVYSTLGDWAQSIDTHRQALALYEQADAQAKVATTHWAIGDAQHEQKEYQTALVAYGQARRRLQQQQNYLQEISLLSSIVRTYEALERYPQARQAAQEMATLAQTQKLPYFQALSQVFIGRVQRAAGDPQAALKTFLAAYQAMQAERSFPLAEANLLRNVGRTYRQLQQPNQAIEAYQAALKLFQQLGQQADTALTFFHIAQVAQDQGNLAQAQTEIEQAIAIIESLRTNIVSPDLRTSYFETVQDYYELYIDILMQRHQQTPQQGYDALALNASERSKARSLLELLTEANTDIRQGIDPELLAQEQQLQLKLSALEKKRLDLNTQAATTAQQQNLETERKQLLITYQRVQDAIRRQSPRYAALKYPEPLTLTEIQQLLDPDTVLLQYTLGSTRSYVWAVTQTQLVSYVLPARAEVEALAKQVQQAIKEQRPTATAQKLSQMILQPAAQPLAKHRRVAIVGDGILPYLPFAALPAPTAAAAPLVTTHEIVNLPSSSTLGVLRQQGTQPLDTKAASIAILADPVFALDDIRIAAKRRSPSSSPSAHQSALDRAAQDNNLDYWQRLTGTQQEAEAIMALFPNKRSDVAFGFDASRNRVLTNAEVHQSQVLHLATHGLLNSRDPQLSGLIFSLINEQGQPQNGFLRLHDVFNLDLQAELVVLSACQTGLGQIVRGEGIVGLTRGFMYAGAPRVVVSLWNVDDAATAEFMTRFYQHIFQGQLSPAAALRQAQQDLQNMPQWRDPYYWAAFTLQGEWR